MSDKKVIFIDYDGTLFHDKYNLPNEDTYQKLIEAKNNNIDIYLTTGRILLTLKEETRLLNIVKGLIGANGCSIIVDNNELEIHYISIEDIYNTLFYAKKNDIQIAYFGRNNAYVYFTDEELFNRFATFNKVPIIRIDDENDIKEKIELICLYSFEEQIDLMIPCFDNLSIYKWGKRGADVVPRNYSKGNAIKKVIKTFNYKFEYTYGIGDGLNDIEMFQNVNVSIAMENARDIVKNNANYVTKSIEENGVIDALNDIINCKI